MKAIDRLKMIVAGIRGRKLSDSEVLQFKCNVNVQLYDEATGELKLDKDYHNLITTAGKDLLLAASSAKKVADFNRVGIGSNSTAASTSDTALGTELARSSGAVTPTNPDSHTLQFQQTFAAGTGTGTVREVGLFDANSSGNMLNRTVIGDIVKAAGDALTVTVQIT